MFEHRLHLSKIGHTFLNGVSLSDLIWTYVVTGAYCLVQGRVWRFYQRNKAYLDPLSSLIGLINEVGSHTRNCLDPLSGLITPFLQPKIQPRNVVHSAGIPILYGNTIYSVRGILFNGIKSKQNHTVADAYQRPHNPHCTTISSDHTQTHALIYQSSTNSYWSDTKPQLNSPL